MTFEKQFLPRSGEFFFLVKATSLKSISFKRVGLSLVFVGLYVRKQILREMPETKPVRNWPELMSSAVALCNYRGSNSSVGALI